MGFWRRRAVRAKARKRATSYALAIEALEPRVLLSADALGVDTGLDINESNPQWGVAEAQAWLDGHNPASTDDIDALLNDDAPVTSSLTTPDDDTVNVRELIIVDANVADSEQLLSELLAGRDRSSISIHLLDGKRDGVEQVSAILSGYDKLDAVHILSHGSAGEIHLGSTTLSNATIDDYSAQLQRWDAALGETADILLYGCEVAADAQGEALVDAIGRLTGADVAASSDITGNLSAGGDWELEVRSGVIEAQALMVDMSTAQWQHTLAFIAYDGFDYTAGEELGNGAAVSGGSGWASDWTDESNRALVVANPGLQDPTGALDTTGNALTTNLGSILHTSFHGRTLNETLGDDESEVWFSFLLTPDATDTTLAYAGLILGENDGDRLFAGFYNKQFNLQNAGATKIHYIENLDPVDGQTYLLTVHLTFAAGDDTLTLYVDPTPGIGSPEDTYSVTKNDIDLDTFNTVVFTAGRPAGESNDSYLDELRVGTTYNDVTPASIIVVNTTDDVHDATITDVDGLNASPGADGKISLREAILAANATAGGDIITFDIPDALVGGQHTINLTTPLDNITDQVVITGQGEPDYMGTPVIKLTGAGTAGLYLDAGSTGSIIRGLELSGFAGDGIYIASDDNTIQGNVISSNSGVGIRIQGDDNRVGGADATQANSIFNNGTHGIRVSNDAAYTGNSFLGNRIYGNSALGIDLKDAGDGGDFVTANDANDGDSGSNDLLNHPVMLAFGQNGADLDLVFELDVPAGDYRIEFFENASGLDPTGHGEGERYLGAANVTSAGSGVQTFSTTLNGVSITDGTTIVATATQDLGSGDYGSTSEFGTATTTQVASADLWLSTKDAVTGGGQSGTATWDAGDLVTIGDPSLSLGGTTSGDFSIAFAGDGFSPGWEMNGAHFVSKAITIGSDNFQLQAGDLLLAAEGGATFTSNTLSGLDSGFSASVVANREDLVVFRPDTPGDYSRGQFGLLIEDVADGNQLRGITLVEQDVTVGGTALSAGDFLFSRSGGGNDDDVWIYETGTTGAGATPVLRQTLLIGEEAGVGIADKIHGIELVETATRVGNQMLLPGTLLLTIDNDATAGGNNLTVQRYDVIQLDVTTSSLAGTSATTASRFFDGSDVAFNDPDVEDLWAVTLAGFIGPSSTGHYLDRFDTNASYAGDDGTLSWSNDWQETVEADGAGGGNAQVQDGFSGDGGGNTELKLKNGNSVWREADLSGAASATLSFDYARVGLEADDHLVVYAQTGGDTGGVGVPGAPGAWDEIGRFSGAADDAAYLSTTIDLSGYLATDTRVLFYAEGASQGDDNIFADNVRIDLGAAPANSPTGATNLTSTSSYTEGDANVAITDIVVSDADSGDTITATLTLADTSTGTLSANDGASYDGGTGIWTITGNVATVNTALANLVFNPATDNDQDTTIAVSIDDGDEDASGALTGTIILSVTAVNDAPVAVDDSYTVDQNGSLTDAAPGVLGNDTDAEGDGLQVIDYTKPTDGNLTIADDGGFTYTPDGGFSGSDGFDYRVSDGNDGLTHYWRLDGDTSDLYGAPDGTINGATQVDGRYGDALYFDGNDHATLADVAYSNEFTVSFWFKLDDNAGNDYRFFYSHGAGGVANSLNIYTIESGNSGAGAGAENQLRTAFLDVDDSVDFNALDVDIGAEGLADGNWHQYTLTVDAATGASVYIDGAFKANRNQGGDAFNPTGDIYLGVRSDVFTDRYLDGSLDGVSIYDHALDVGEVADQFSGGSALATVDITVTANIAPTFTAFSGAVQSTAEDTQVEITLADLLAAGNEADADGTVDSFVVKSVSSGTLLIGATPGGAVAWQVGVNDVIESGKNAYWTPAADANGTLDAFNLVARDDDGAESVGPVTAQVSVASVNDDPTADAGGGYAIDEGGDINANASASGDSDGSIIQYRWDLNNDLDYSDLVTASATPTFDWATLAAWGLDEGSVTGTSYTIGLQVVDDQGGSDETTTTVTITDVAPTLSVSGTGSVNAGSLYTLNLTATDPGADTITSWTINWGDGNVDTFAGDPASVNHTYATGGFTYNVLVSATDSDGTWLQNELLVANYADSDFSRYAATSGDFLGAYTGGGGLNNTVQPVIGPDGLLYVSGYSAGSVLRFDAATLGFVDEFVSAGSGGLGSAGGIAFGPDGHLYVADYGNDRILKYDAADGSPLGVFVTAASGGLDQPWAILFGPDSDLYVGSYSNNEILRYDGSSGAFDRVFVDSADNGGLNDPEQMVFGDDGNLYVASYGTDQVLRFDGSSGAFLDVFISSGGLDRPTGFLFGPDGRAYVTDYTDDEVLRYNETTGTFIDTYANMGMNGAGFMTFIPGHQVDVSVVPNVAPTFTQFTAPVASGDEDSEIEVSFAQLAAQGDETDSDGTVDAFIVKAISSGTLKIGADPGSALAWSAGGNDRIDASNKAYWTPEGDANGTLNAFEVVARDDEGDDSSTNVMAQVTVNAINDAPGATNLTSTSNYTEGAASVGITDIVVSDVDTGDTIMATLTLADTSTGSLSANNGAIYDGGTGIWTITGNVATVNTALANLVFNPATDNDQDTTIAVSIDDGDEDTSGPLTGTITLDVTPVNDAPTLSGTYDLGSTGIFTTTGGVRVSTILAGVTANDVDGDTLGMALYSLSGLGDWEFSTDSSDGVDGNWYALGAVATDNALLLDEAAWLRYVPDGGSSETAGFDFLAWDQTGGTASTGGSPSYADTVPVQDRFSTGSADATLDVSQQLSVDDDAYATDADSVLTVDAIGVLDNDEVLGAHAVTAGATLEYLAWEDTDANNSWEDETGLAGYDMNLVSAAATRDADPANAPSGIGASYVFNGSGAAVISELMESLPGDPTNGEVSFELWIRPSDAVGTEILLDLGSATGALGHDGASLRLNGSVLEWAVWNDGSLESVVVTTDIAAEIASGEFIQVIASFDPGLAGTAYLRINGGAAVSGSNLLVTDWASNSEATGIGGIGGVATRTYGSVGADPFEGEIAAFRMYESVLSNAEAQANYDATRLTVVAYDATSANGASVSMNADGSFSYDPGSVFAGLAHGDTTTDTFSYTAQDSEGNQDSATVTVTLTGVNDAPTATNLSSTSSYTEGDLSVAIDDIVVSDVDANEIITATLTLADTATGTLSANDGASYTPGTGVWTITGDVATVNTALANLVFNPASENEADTTVGVVIDDGNEDGGAALTGTISLNVTPVNDAPTLSNFVDGVAVTPEETEVEITLATLKAFGDEADIDGTVDGFVVKSVANGTLKIGADAGSAVAWSAGVNDRITSTLNAYWTPNTDINGIVTAFTAAALDDGGAESVGTADALVSVTPVNDPPAIATNTGATLAEGDSGVLIGSAQLAASDVDNAAIQLVYTLDSGPNSGVLRLDGVALAVTDTFTQDDIDNNRLSYDHDDGETVADAFGFTLVDGAGGTVNGTFSLTITPVNDNDPVADAESFTVVEGGTATQADLDAGVSLLDGDSDADLPNDTLTVNTTPVSGPSHGVLTLNGDGTFSYTHDGSENFSDSFVYELLDADGGVSDTATVTITITPVNDNDPVADAESFTVTEGGTATQADLDVGTSLLDGDSDADQPNDTLTINTTPVSGPSHGALTLNSDGTFSYTHDGSENFSDSFVYELLDADGGVSDTATVTITIAPVNDNDPVADDESFTVVEGGTATQADLDLGISLLDGDSDADQPNDTLTINTTPVSGPSHGALTLNGDGTFSYTHDGSENFSDSFVYELRDADGGVTDTATVNITITPQNDTPVLTQNTLSLNPGDRVVLTTADLAATDADDIDATLTFGVSNVTGGQFELLATPGIAITSFTQAQVLAGQVVFADDGDSVAPAYSVSVDDGTTTTAPQSASITLGSVSPVIVTLPADRPAIVPPLVTPEVEPPAKSASEEAAGGDEPGDSSDASDEETGAEDSVVTPAPDVGAESDATGDGDSVETGFNALPVPSFDNTPNSFQPSLQSFLHNLLVKPTLAVAGQLFDPVSGFDLSPLSAQIRATLASSDFDRSLDRMRDDISNATLVHQSVVGSGVAVTTGLSVGYVAWLVRGGVLLSTALSSLPAWQFVDPLPVLARTNDKEDDDDDDSLEGIIKERSDEVARTQEAEASATAAETGDGSRA